MNKLKGIFYTFVSAVLIVACEPVENSYTVDTYMLDVYTIGGNSALIPEFEDTLLKVTNMGEFDLAAGERVCLYVYNHFDAYNPKNSELKIVNVVEKIPTLSIAEREGINSSEYELLMRPISYYYQPSIWVWNNRLNVNALFHALPENTDFVMSIRDIQNDTVNFNLLGKTTAPSDSLHTKLLSYDLNNLKTLLTDDEKAGLNAHEKLTFRIFMKYKDSKDSLMELGCGVEKGEFVNPLY